MCILHSDIILRQPSFSFLQVASDSESNLNILNVFLQDASDSESTLNILNVLDELLSAGTDRRIHYMIKKGGSEALLRTLVNTGCSPSPTSTILVPLMHLLTKVGHRDKKIGHKAEKAGAVLLPLDLLRQSQSDVKMAVACLWLLRVYASCVSTAALLGKNGALEVQFKLIAPHTKKHTRMVKESLLLVEEGRSASIPPHRESLLLEEEGRSVSMPPHRESLLLEEEGRSDPMPPHRESLLLEEEGRSVSMPPHRESLPDID
ncbi:UNVERIFIED_CONTAM: hypothetical protein FKN15_005822 [Acipenser sinensis]